MNIANIKATGIPDTLEQYQLALDCAVAAGQAAALAKLRAGVEVPEAFAHAAYEEHPSYEGVGDIVYYHPNAKPANCIDLFTRNQLLQYVAAQRLAAREQAIEECAQCIEEQDTQAPKYNARAIRALAASPQEQT